MMKFFRPIKGCRIVASESHPLRKPMSYIGEVLAVDGNVVKFRGRAGDTDSLIWRFRDGNNKYIYFSA